MPRKTDPRNLERVLDAAAELFLDVGYDGFTMQQLADDLGLHKSTLYHYVDSKDELFERLASTSQERAAKDLKRAASEEDPGRAALMALRLAVEQTIGDLGRVSLVLRKVPGSEIGEAVTERRRAHDRAVADLIEHAQRAGQIRDDIPATLLARLSLGMMSWLVEWYRPGRSRFDPAEVADAIMKVLQDGIAVGENSMLAGDEASRSSEPPRSGAIPPE